jgi:hypothetical protein
MKHTLGQRISLLIKAYPISKSGFAKVVGISTVALDKIIDGRTAEPRQETIDAIVKKFGTTHEFLRFGKGEMLPNGIIDLHPSENPWKDEAYVIIKEDRDRLSKEVERLWGLIGQFTNGKQVNFLKSLNKTAVFRELYPKTVLRDQAIRA